jgi:four helix bundle protein
VLFLNDLGWRDTARLVRERRTIGLYDQLYRAAESISANLDEGYSRGTGRDRARFYEYALGSARESRDWCLSASRPGRSRLPAPPAVAEASDFVFLVSVCYTKR